MEFYSVRKGLEFWRGLTNQIFSHKHPLDTFPDASFLLSKARSIFRKETKQNLRPITFQYWNQMTTKLARYIYI